jgi:hypothetical protein
MKISIFTSMTNPEERQDPWKEALNCYEDLADEVIIVGEDWPEEFSWDYIGQTFQKGLETSTGDWAIRMDLDYFFHEKDFDYIRKFLEKNNHHPVVAFPKRQFFTADRYQIQSRICIAVNKTNFPNVKLNGGGDLCFPTLNGTDLNPYKLPLAKSPIWNYDMMFKSKEIIAKERLRFGNAWFNYFGEKGIFNVKNEEEAFETWFKWIEVKYKKHVFKIKSNKHPIYIQERLSKLDSSQFGYSAFGLKESTKINYKDLITGYKNRFLNATHISK